MSKKLENYFGNGAIPIIFPDYTEPRMMGLMKDRIIPDVEVLFKASFE